jgi:hypothetical protein
MDNQQNKFKDEREHIYQFMDEFIVKCPSCHSRAYIKRIDPENHDWFAPRRFICSCGKTSDWHKREISRPWGCEPLDDYFNYPLWLQISCCGETLWAYNKKHLEFIKEYVQAELRERSKDEDSGWSNQSLASRLPKWIKSKKNRKNILKAIGKLENKLKAE